MRESAHLLLLLFCSVLLFLVGVGIGIPYGRIETIDDCTKQGITKHDDKFYECVMTERKKP